MLTVCTINLTTGKNVGIGTKFSQAKTRDVVLILRATYHLVITNR